MENRPSFRKFDSEGKEGHSKVGIDSPPLF